MKMSVAGVRLDIAPLRYVSSNVSCLQGKSIYFFELEYSAKSPEIKNDFYRKTHRIAFVK